MNSVFSNYLIKAWCPKQNDGCKLKATIDRLSCIEKANNTYAYWHFVSAPHIFTMHALTRNEYFGQSYYITQCFTNDAFKKVVVWVNKNILLQLTKDNYITTNVKIRIATSMINKCLMQEKLSKDFGIIAHDILVSNIKELQSVLRDEELPF